MRAGRKTGKGKRSMRRDRENQSWPACARARKSGLDPIRVSPYGPAAHPCRIERPDTRKHLTAGHSRPKKMLASTGASTHGHDEVKDRLGRRESTPIYRHANVATEQGRSLRQSSAAHQQALRRIQPELSRAPGPNGRHRSSTRMANKSLAPQRLICSELFLRSVTWRPVQPFSCTPTPV